MVEIAPLFFCAVGLILGILVQSRVGIGFGAWVVLSGFCICAAVVVFLRRGNRNVTEVLACAALVSFACLGAVRWESFNSAGPGHINSIVSAEKKLATVRGVIKTRPRIQRTDDWAFGRFVHRDPSSSFYMKVEEVQGRSGWRQCEGQMRVQVYEPVMDLARGDRVEIYCWLERPEGATNPGQFDFARYLRRRGIYACATVKNREGIVLLNQRGDRFLGDLREWFKGRANSALLAGELGTEANKGLLEALLLGDRGDIDRATYRAFERTGLLHFISLSGLHLGIMMGIVWFAGKTMGLLKRGRAVLCLGALAAFMLVVPWRAPTVRGAIICAVFCLSFFFRRKPNSLNSLSLAAILLLFFRPTNLFEVGWQLSFACVAGILAFTEPMMGWFQVVPRRIGLGNRRLDNYRWGLHLAKSAAGLMAVGVSAWLGAAGILLYYFHTINLLTWLWTVVVFPVVAWLLVLGYLKMLLVFVLPTAGTIIGYMAGWLSSFLIWLVKAISEGASGQILVGQVGVGLVAVYYATVGFGRFVRMERIAIKRTVMILAAAGMLFYVAGLKYPSSAGGRMELSVLDVGHGQALLMEGPGGEKLLFDAGSLFYRDIGRGTVNPYLKWKGINRLERVIVSHDDVDHMNGVCEVVEDVEVEGVYSSGDFLRKARQGQETAGFLRKELEKRDLKMQVLEEEFDLGAAKVRILWPDEQVCGRGGLSDPDDNDMSIVAAIEYAGRCILITSDIGQYAQREIMRKYPDLRADVMLVPHHGSVSSGTDEFVESVAGGILISSCDSTQYRRQKGWGVYEDKKCFFTARDGAVRVTVDARGQIKVFTTGRKKRGCRFVESAASQVE